MFGTSKTRSRSSVERVSRGIAALLYDDRAADEGSDHSNSTAPLKSAEVVLSAEGTLMTQRHVQVGEELRQSRDLAVAIRQRIETRLGKRISALSVQVSENRVIMRGNCATYYSKQLAQHAALGVIEDEALDNRIEVSISE